MSRSTLAAVARSGRGNFSLEQVRLDSLRDDEVLVQIRATGMCHTDLSAKDGGIPFPLPGVLGHEGAGVVLEVGGAVRRVGPGDKVLLSFTSCGSCSNCRAGRPAYCQEHLQSNLLGGTRTDGSGTIFDDEGKIGGHFFGQSSFAETAIVDERSVIRLPDGTSDDDLITLAPLGCGVQTGAGTVFNVLKPGLGTTLVIAGAGAVGLGALMAAALTPVSEIIVVDVVPHRLELALDLGATQVVNAFVQDTHSFLMDFTGGRGVDAAIETTGNVDVLGTLVESLAVGGVCAVIGAPHAGTRSSFDVNALLPGRQIRGVTLGDSEPETLIPQLVQLFREGKFPLDRLERRYRFKEINTAASDAASGKTIKPILVMGKH